MTRRDNNPDRLDDGARAEAEMKEREAIGPELKPCPFCGGTDISVDKAGNASHYFCTCNDCDVVQDYDHNYTRDDAIAVWNRRTAPALPAPQGDDGLARRLEVLHECLTDKPMDRVRSVGMATIRDAADALRARASEIERWAKNALDNDDSRIAAESRLASAMEALERARYFIYAPAEDLRDSVVSKIDAALSSIKRGEAE